ncbi:hypothetical protein BD560DRAFT_490145 [Blakeslea trispora]|nr:hypothetical protein BD560DRAFT_490145 [Blakeslea trispora]
MKLLNTFRYLTLLFSLLGAASHFAQCTLFTIYQKQTGIPSWLSGGHWQYLIIYIAFGLSITSAFMLCVHATCCKRGHVVRGDRTLGLFNSIASMATLTVITVVYSQEPWTNNIIEFKLPAKGFVPYCSLLDQAHDATYPLLFQRCLLFNCTYIILSALCVLWALLTIIACTTSSSKSKQHPLQQHMNKRMSVDRMSSSTCKKQKQIQPVYDHMDFQYADHSVHIDKNTAQGPYLDIPAAYHDNTMLARYHQPSLANSDYASNYR